LVLQLLEIIQMQAEKIQIISLLILIRLQWWLLTFRPEVVLEEDLYYHIIVTQALKLE